MISLRRVGLSLMEYGNLCRIRVKHPSTNEWEKGYIEYEESGKKTGSNKAWAYDFYLTTPSQ